MKHCLLTLCFLLIATGIAAARGVSDLNVSPLTISTEAPAPDIHALKKISPSESQRWWLNLARQGKLNLQDTSVIYPKFVKFCVDVYNWADRFFNSYDPEYVVGTGKRWKVRVLNDNWADSYAMTLPGKLQTEMLSNVYSNIGAYIQYMAVSMGYTYDMSKFFGTSSLNHKKWEFGFNCALFNAEIYYQENTGGTNLRKFGKFNNGHHIKEKFPGVELYNFGLEAYYFFNNKKYSQGASYNFSKIQKKSQGSFLAGFIYTNLKISFDFTQLPLTLLPYLTILPDSYLFHYKTFGIMFGYGFNWVIKPKLLFNISAMPSLGISHCYEDSLEGEKHMFAMNVAARTSLTYNLGNFFFSIIGKMRGSWYKSGTYSLFSSVENFSANIGFRF